MIPRWGTSRKKVCFQFNFEIVQREFTWSPEAQLHGKRLPWLMDPYIFIWSKIKNEFYHLCCTSIVFWTNLNCMAKPVKWIVEIHWNWNSFCQPIKWVVCQPIKWMVSKPIKWVVCQPIKWMVCQPIKWMVCKPIKWMVCKPIKWMVCQPIKWMVCQPIK